MELEFVSDAAYCMAAKFKAFRHNWPPTLDMVAELQTCMKKNVDIADLRSFGCFSHIRYVFGDKCMERRIYDACVV